MKESTAESSDFALARHHMVQQQIARRGLHNPRLLAAFESVPRHLFVPEELRYAAYDDSALPIGFGQTISQPYIVALMTSLLDLKGDERVLEVGTGSGYQAAILAHLAREVFTIEFDNRLALRAEETLRRLGLSNAHVFAADGSLGWPQAAPFKGIVVAAAAPQVPKPLLGQLADGGRLVVPVNTLRHQLLELWTRHGEHFSHQVITSVRFVPLRGAYGRKRS